MRFRPAWLLLVVSFALAGCSAVRVRVDSRLTSDADLWRLLEEGTYAIRGPDETAEASLAFQEGAEILANALQLQGHQLKRVAPGEPADVNLTMIANVTDLGTGTTSYPVYGRDYGYAYGPYGVRRYHSYGVIGTQVETYHLGYDRTLFVSAWVSAEGVPAGRRVAWEGFAGCVGDSNSFQEAMPFLALGLASFFGESTGGPEKISFSSDDDRVELVLAGVRSVEPPTTREE